MTSQFYEWQVLHEKSLQWPLAAFGHMFNDVKTAELALVPCSKWLLAEIV